MRVGAIIQSRMGSTRLSGKIMMELHGKTVLSHVIERVKQSTVIDEIIIATTNLERDDVIDIEAKSHGARVFRGSEDDVLSRYYLAAKEFELDIIVRITSDCPLIDIKVTDSIVNFYLENEYDVVTNASAELKHRTYPRGLDTEVFSMKSLEDAYVNAREKYQREHVTPYIYENADSIYYYKNDTDYSKYRWTLDTPEDFKLIKAIYDRLYNGKHEFYLNDVIGVFEEEPELINININIEQKKIKE